MKSYYRQYLLILATITLLVVGGCRSTKTFSCVWQNQLDYAYDSVVLLPDVSMSIDICGATFKNKDNGALFQDVRRLTLNCDSTFTWKHVSCIRRDTCFGYWTVRNSIIYLTTGKELKKKISKQEFGDIFGDYIDLGNTALVFNNSFVVWQRTPTWTDTLYRR
jgi:hypothetical protein